MHEQHKYTTANRVPALHLFFCHTVAICWTNQSGDQVKTQSLRLKMWKKNVKCKATNDATCWFKLKIN